MADDKKDGKSKPWSDKKKFQVALAGFSIIAVVAGGVSCNHTTDPMYAARYGTYVAYQPIQTNIVITKQPSATFRLPRTVALPTHEISAGLIEDSGVDVSNVSFVVEVNGGPSQGGWLVHIPSKQSGRIPTVYNKGRVFQTRYWIEPKCPVVSAPFFVDVVPLGQSRFPYQ